MRTSAQPANLTSKWCHYLLSLRSKVQRCCKVGANFCSHLLAPEIKRSFFISSFKSPIAGSGRSFDLHKVVNRRVACTAALRCKVACTSHCQNCAHCNKTVSGRRDYVAVQGRRVVQHPAPVEERARGGLLWMCPDHRSDSAGTRRSGQEDINFFVARFRNLERIAELMHDLGFVGGVDPDQAKQRMRRVHKASCRQNDSSESN